MLKTTLVPTLIIVCLAPALDAQAIATFRVASGLSRPVGLGAPPGDTERIFILEQWEARIRIVRNGTLLATPFLDLSPAVVINSGSERGLLGLAFHPDYATNGYFFLNYNNPSGHTVIARYSRSAANPDLADAASGVILQMTPGVTTYSFSQPFSNHNGGWIGFGPDGYLYIANGDGGSAGDPQGNGQSINTLLGKMLRVDVNNPNPPYYSIPAAIPANPFAAPGVGGRDEIWSYGLRNPWRCSFDRVTGEMWIGDVGQNAREEIDYEPAATPGRNYGWNCREGIANYAGCTPPNYVPPIYDYSQGSGGSQGFCITGGYVYRGCAIPGLEGTYFFGDYSNSRIWSFRKNATGTGVTNFTDRTASLFSATNGGTVSSPSSFGEDGLGEIYIVDHGGEVFKIVPASSNNNAATLSLAGPPTVGTTLTINLSSPTDPNRSYALGLALGTDPGIVLPDQREIQLTIDALLLFTIDPASPIMANHYGTLDGSGLGSVQVLIPNDPTLATLSVYAAYVTLEATASAGVSRISCPLKITVQ